MIQEARWVKLQDLPTWSRKRNKSAEKPLVFFKVAPFVQYVHIVSTTASANL
jgi:hypothetical protein